MKYISIGLYIIVVCAWGFGAYVFLNQYDHGKAYRDCSWKWDLKLESGKAVSKWSSSPSLPPTDILEICAKVLKKERRLNNERRWEALENLRDYSK